MTEFTDPVPHAGGVLTIHKQGAQYSLSYHHMNHKRVGLAELIAVNGNAVAVVPIAGVSSNPAPAPPELMVMLPTDGEAMYGRHCPECHSYFRTSHPFTELCPYCVAKAAPFEFFTEDQRSFIKRQHDAIIAAMQAADGDTRIDFDAQIAQPDCKDPWVYSDERQQTRFQCVNCHLEYDVLGQYVRCPHCGRRTAREVITRTLSDLSRDFESDAKGIPKDERERRQRQWRAYVVSVVAIFEALGRDVAGALARLPCTPARRKAILALSFQRLNEVAHNLRDWFGLDLLDQLGEDDKTHLHLMFNRRHLFAHCDGKVDREYLDKTNDTTVRLNQVLTVDSKQVRRLVATVTTVATNLLDGFDSITPPK